MLFGEIFGKGIQKGFDYGLEGVAFNVFDVWNIVLETWFYRPEDVANRLGIPMVPRIYDGIWSPELEYLADEPSAYTNKHCSEGIVIKGETTLKLKGIKFCSR